MPGRAGEDTGADEGQLKEVHDMVGWIGQFGPVMQALIATLFTLGVTALGAGLVFFFKSINKKVLNGMLGFAAGVMVAASFWSLLAPGIELAEELGQVAYVTAGRLELLVKGKVTVLETGDSFTMPRGVPHNGVNPGSDVARLVITLVVDKGAQPRQPVPEPK